MPRPAAYRSAIRRGGTFVGDAALGTRWSGLVECPPALPVFVAATPLPRPVHSVPRPPEQVVRHGDLACAVVIVGVRVLGHRSCLRSGGSSGDSPLDSWWRRATAAEASRQPGSSIEVPGWSIHWQPRHAAWATNWTASITIRPARTPCQRGSSFEGAGFPDSHRVPATAESPCAGPAHGSGTNKRGGYVC